VFQGVQKNGGATRAPPRAALRGGLNARPVEPKGHTQPSPRRPWQAGRARHRRLPEPGVGTKIATKASRTKAEGVV
jgi:hypothetical protein